MFFSLEKKVLSKCFYTIFKIKMKKKNFNLFLLLEIKKSIKHASKIPKSIQNNNN